MYRLDSSGSGLGPVADSCDCGNERFYRHTHTHTHIFEEPG
jgi:hypothetical protein